MKFAIGTIGNRLDSLVVKRFEHAAWYLIVDDSLRISEAVQHRTPHDRHRILEKMASEEVDAIVAGKFSKSSLHHFREKNLRVIHVHGIQVREAVDRIISRKLVPEEIQPLESEGEIAVGTVERVLSKATQLRTLATSSGSYYDSDRGRHHVQQYGGRGH